MYLWKEQSNSFIYGRMEQDAENMDMRGWRTVGRKMTDILASRPVELLLTDADSVDITDSEAVNGLRHINRPIIL